MNGQTRYLKIKNVTHFGREGVHNTLSVVTLLISSSASLHKFQHFFFNISSQDGHSLLRFFLSPKRKKMMGNHFGWTETELNDCTSGPLTLYLVEGPCFRPSSKVIWWPIKSNSRLTKSNLLSL